MARTTALNKIEEAILTGKRYIVVDGGTGAGKTYDIMTEIIGYCESFPNIIFTVVGKSHKHLERGCIRDLKSVMNETGRWNQTRWNETKSIYTFPNSSILEFISADDMDAHGPKRDGLFVNEANSMKWSVFDQLATRTRDIVIIDFNPSYKFWAHEELLEGRFKERTAHVTLTYKDNEALSEEEIRNIEDHKPKAGEEPSNWWIVYGLGQLGSLEGNVYQGWEEKDEDYIVENGRLVRYGLDFGFSNDESALVAIYDMGENRLGVVEKVFEKGVLNSQYAQKFNVAQVEPSVLIVADSARPEAIAEIRSNGFRIVGADKNAGSVLRGIERVSEKQIYYYGENLKREYLSYAWRKKRSGEILDEPQDGNDHLLDALRYAVDDLAVKPVSWAGPR